MTQWSMGYYLTRAMKDLKPPTDWDDILERGLQILKRASRRKYDRRQLRNALEVGLRFGVIKEIQGKYYLYEYGQLNEAGDVTYPFLPKIIRMKEFYNNECAQQLNSSSASSGSNVSEVEAAPTCAQQVMPDIHLTSSEFDTSQDEEFSTEATPLEFFTDFLNSESDLSEDEELCRDSDLSSQSQINVPSRKRKIAINEQIQAKRKRRE